MGMIPELERQYPEGSDITIMNTYYQYPKFEDNKKICDDFIVLVYKDNTTMEKKYKIITKPTYTFYQIKKDIPVPPYNQLFIPIDQVDAIKVPFTKLEKTIAERTGNEDLYEYNIQNRNKAGNAVLHTDPSIFMSDVNIQDHYRFKFANTYTNDIKKLSKGFFDIEVDGKWAKGDFVELGECAINCVSFCDEKSDMIYVFILRDDRNPLIQEFEDEIKSGKLGFKQIHEFIVDNVGGDEKAEKYGLTNTQFSFNFYDDELQLISELFGTMHQCSPDFIEGWNGSAFDTSYIIQRIYNLGSTPEQIMTDPRWPVQVVKHYVDQRNINMLAERGDYTFISGLPVFIDQMIQYASRRKSKIGSFKSFKLDDIGLKEAGVKKLDYHHITNSVTELPWLDFKTFVLYNIMDVVVQKCIEKKTNDLEYIFSKCVVNNTSYNKGHRQTVYLVNRMASDWYKMGFIIGNNINKNNPKPPKYLGALVGKPLNTNSYSKMSINDVAIWVCENLIDYDFKSLYPSIMGEDNIAPNTQIGRIEMDQKIYDNENIYGIDPDKYSRGGEFIENLVTDNFIEYAHRWFHLGNIQDTIFDIDEYFNRCNLGNYSELLTQGYNGTGYISPILPTSSGIRKITFEEPKKYRSPIIFYNKRNTDLNYESLKEKDK